MEHKKATRIILIEDSKAFLEVEDALYMGRIRFFLNKKDNSSPVYFFVKLDDALCMAYDMFTLREFTADYTATGYDKNNQPIVRRFYLDTHVATDLEDDFYYYLDIDNLPGKMVGKNIEPIAEEEGKYTQIEIYPEDARRVGAAMLLRLLANL